MQLQQPDFAYMQGKLVPWKDAKLHIGCEALTRGLSVFEGLKGYWQPNRRFGMVTVRRHYERLRRSARLLHIPWDATYEQYESAVFELVGALARPGRDLWTRTTLFVVEGHWGEGTVADLVITAYQQDIQTPHPIRLGVSTWRRSSDLVLPPRIKSSANYQVARVARIEGRAQGCQDMVLLNESGRAAETTAAAILVVRDGTIYTPPSTEGALESITVDLLESMSTSMGIPFVRRPIDRTELLVADEIGICGTITELALAQSIEGQPLSKESPVLSALQKRYLNAVRGVDPHPSVEMSMLPASATGRREEKTDPTVSVSL